MCPSVCMSVCLSIYKYRYIHTHCRSKDLYFFFQWCKSEFLSAFSLQSHIILQKSFQYVHLLAMLLFLSICLSKNPEQKCHRFQKILNRKTVSNTGNTSVLEWFHMNLKTGVTADEISHLHHWIQLYFKVYIIMYYSLYVKVHLNKIECRGKVHLFQ